MNRLRFALSWPLLLTVLVAGQLTAHADDAPRHSFQEPGQRQVPIGWPYKAIPVVHPELMAGGWESADGSGTADRLLIQMGTSIGTWIIGSSEERLVELFVSGSIRLGSGEPIRLSINARLPGPIDNPALNAIWTDKHLRLGSNVGATGAVGVDMRRTAPIELELTFDDTRVEWTGTFASSGLAKPVRFSRPRASGRAPLAGYWCIEEAGWGSCVRINEGADGNVQVSEDSVSWSGRAASLSGQGQYGEERHVFETPAPDAIRFAHPLATGAGGYHFSGRLSSDGTRLEGQMTWPFAPPNSGYAPRPRTLIKSTTGAWPASSQRPWPESSRRP